MQPRRDVGLAPLLPSHVKGASPVVVKLRRNVLGEGGKDLSLVF